MERHARVRPLTERRPRTDRSDEQLVEAALHHDRRAFEALVRRHQRALVSHIHRLTGQREVAVDLAQDVFLKVYQSLASFDPRYRFTTWLYRIGSNCAIDYLRKRRPPTCSLPAEPSAGGGNGVAAEVAGTAPAPDEVVHFRELRHRIEDAIRCLPAEYRQLILLRHRLHCRYDEIARITELPLGTVKNRIFRAREMLRNRLHDVLEDD